MYKKNEIKGLINAIEAFLNIPREYENCVPLKYYDRLEKFLKLLKKYKFKNHVVIIKEFKI